VPNKRSITLLILLALLALLGGQHILELRAEEPRRAIVAMEMVLNQEYAAATINDLPYYNKPPGFNWAVAASYRLLGSMGEWATRFPSILAFLLMVLANYLFVRRALGPVTALLSSAFLVTSADLLFYGTVNSGEIDLFFSCIVYLQAMSIFWFWQRRQWWPMFLISYALCGIGMLVKPPAVLFQGFTLLALALYDKRMRVLFGLPHMAGLALFALIVGGYFYSYPGDGAAYLVHLFAEGADKTGASNTFGDIMAGAAEFPLQLLKLMAPWSILLLFWFRKGFMRELLADPFMRFCGLFIVANIWVYWFSGDVHLRYVYMFIPFFCALLAHSFVRYAHRWKRMKHYLESGLGVVMALAASAVLVAAWFMKLPLEDGTVWRPSGVWMVSAIAAGGMAALAWLYWKQSAHRMLLLAALMLMLRCWFNYTVLPFTDAGKALTYKERVGELLAITGSEAVHWAGPSWRFPVELNIVGNTLVSAELESATKLAYQLPYYISKGNGHVMRWDRELQPDTYYLMYIGMAEKLELEPLFQIRDRWLSKELVLVRTGK